MIKHILLSKFIEHEVILPRLTLSYYILLAILITAILFILWLVFKNKEIIRKCISKILMLTSSYIVSQISLKGFKFATYTLQEDLIIILFRTLFIFLILLIINELILSRTNHFN